MIDAASIGRLEAMDIQVWCRRDRAAPATVSRTAAPERIRLEAGSGPWLLVVDDAERARHADLLEDIRATLGAGDCRFGTWSDSPDSGVAMSDWEAHGIRHALVFGEGDDSENGLIYAGRLEALSATGALRRVLWQRLKPHLKG